MNEPNYRAFAAQRLDYRRACETGQITPEELAEIEAEMDEEIAEIEAETPET